ncbi:hypothetical protein BDN67DRAFT_1014277 [Paxillus ammoniavirescens]|nr:hypothetical protein BDN67DRAFT_1014277 [Paxillus ammoniavirescens]
MASPPTKAPPARAAIPVAEDAKENERGMSNSMLSFIKDVIVILMKDCGGDISNFK